MTASRASGNRQLATRGSWSRAGDAEFEPPRTQEGASDSTASPRPGAQEQRRRARPALLLLASVLSSWTHVACTNAGGVATSGGGGSPGGSGGTLGSGATNAGGDMNGAGGLSTGGAPGGGGVATDGGAVGGQAAGGAATGGSAAGGGGAATGGAASGGADSGTGGVGGADPNFHLFLLIGQSNMVGLPQAESSDKVENPNVLVLGYNTCGSRVYNEWDVAAPPLHTCGDGLGPGDYFAKAVAEEYPQAKIGLIPCGIPGVDIDMFRKGVVSSRRGEFNIPPDNHWSGAYDWVIERAQLAQQEGVIRGILFHQGESNPGQNDWPGKVAEIVEDLRADLALDQVPFLAGELLPSCACSGPHNPLIGQLPTLIDDAYVVSSADLGAADQYHFNLAAQRTLGQRYAEAFLAVFQP